MAMRRWVGWAREVVRLMRGLPDEDLQRRNLAMHEQLIRVSACQAGRASHVLKDLLFLSCSVMVCI